MGDASRGEGDARRGALVRTVLLLGIGLPLVLLGGLYVGADLVGIVFGDLVFALSIVAVVAWLAFVGRGRRMDATRPTGELFRRSATVYGEEVARGTFPRLPLPARLLFVLTGTAVLGWVVLLATW